MLFTNRRYVITGWRGARVTLAHKYVHIYHGATIGQL